MRRHRSHQDGESDYWPAVVDVFIGFLSVILLVVVAAYALARQQAEGSRTPPTSIQQFKEQFAARLVKPAQDAGRKSEELPHILREGFSELTLRFPASFLFDPCEYHTKDEAQEQIVMLRELLFGFKDTIERVQVTGHTDGDRPSPNDRCGQQNIRNNWQLSALRAITILEAVAPEPGAGAGLDPEKIKIWAAALGPYERVVVREITDGDKQQNRRIEIVVKFKEQ